MSIKRQADDTYSVLLGASVRWIAILLALGVVIFVILANFGLARTAPLYSTASSTLIALLAVSGGIWAYFHRHRTVQEIQPYIIPFHILGLCITLLLTGFSSPITLFWIVLIAITGIVFQQRYMLLSVLFLTAIVMVDLSSYPIFSIDIISHLMYLTMIIILAWFIASLQAVQSLQHDALVKEKSNHSAERLKLLSLVNNVNEAIVSIDVNGRITLYNSAMLNLLDTNQDLIGKKLSDLFKTHTEDDEKTSLIKLIKSSPVYFHREDVIHTLTNGEDINLSLSGSRIKDNDDTDKGYILIIHDITAQKSLEDERDEFISVASHELRTPVTIVEGSLSNAKMLIEKGAAPSVVHQALSVSYEQVNHLARIINDLSTLSRAERGIGSEQEVIDVAELTRNLFNDYEKKAAASKLRLDLNLGHSLGSVMTSRVYLEEILQNFLTNAIKYTAKGSITLSVKRQDDTVTFSVKDSGIGISAKEFKKIFQKFYRSEDYRTRETTGTGLGLYIVDKLAKKIGAVVDVKSHLNHGSTFSLSLSGLIVDKDPIKRV